jgi:hypothetical protein
MADCQRLKLHCGPSLEHELPSAVANERFEQPSGGNVQERRHAHIFQLPRLGRSAPGDECERGRVGQQGLHLFLAQLGRREPEQARAPALVAKLLVDRGQELLDRRLAQQRQGQKGKRAPFGNVLAERRHVANPRHRALRNRILRAVRPGPGPTRTERLLTGRQFQASGDRRPIGRENAAHRAVQ